MKKFFKSVVILIVTLGLIYFVGLGYYTDRFIANTKAFDIGVSNLTTAQANELIEDSIKSHKVTLTEDGQKAGEISLADIFNQAELESFLEVVYQEQDPSLWFVEAITGSNYDGELSDYVKLDSQVLAEKLNEQGINNEGRTPTVDAYIDYSDEEGYHIDAEKLGNTVDYQALAAGLVDSVQSNKNTLALEDFYTKAKVTADSDTARDALAELDKITDIKITLDLGDEEVTIPKDLIEKWLYFSGDNSVTLDRDEVSKYLKELNEEYSTYSDYREFESTLQGTVTVQPGILGWEIDVDSEVDQLIADINKGEDIKRKPMVSSTGGNPVSPDEIGDTYIEVDLDYQQMFLYVDGQQIVHTDIVSGQPGAETVPGANAVNEKLVNTNLTGFNHIYGVSYSTPVSYWIRFDNQAQGIHDASWQGWFGGDARFSNGSLGCINTPYSAVSIIYENVDYGTPVIVF